MSVHRQVSAIVVAYGKGELLGRCLVRLERALERLDGRTELSSSSTTPPSRSGRRSAEPVVVAGGPDLGFAGGVTAGLPVARGRWIALVNDDCMIEADSLAELLAVGERTSASGRWRRRCSSPAGQDRQLDRPRGRRPRGRRERGVG